MIGFTMIDILVLVVYLSMVLVIGLLFSKKDMKGKEFFKGDGTVPWWVTSVSIFATLLSPISFLSLVGNSYNGTWILWFAQLGMIIAIPLTVKYFLPLYSKLKIDTAYEYLEVRYNDKGLRVLGALMFIIYQVGRMSIVMYLPSMVLANLTGIHINILIVLMGLIAIVYSYTGGLKAVLWTDFIQGLVLILGVLGVLVVLIFSIEGGFKTVINELTANSKFLSPQEVIFDKNILSSSVFIILVGAGFNTFSSYISSQDVVQRFTTTTDIKKLKKMTYGNGLLSIGITTIFYFIGTALYVFYNQNAHLVNTVHRDQIFASYIAFQLPVGVSGLLLAAIYAAAQSTLSTGLNSIATSWTLDIRKMFFKKISEEKETKIAKVVSLVVGVLAIIISIIMANGEIKSAYEWFNSFMGLVLGVLAGIFVLGTFTKKACNIGAYAGFISSLVVILFLKYGNSTITPWAYSIISILVCLIVGYVVSSMRRIIFVNN